jgi:type II secretory pathway component PulC
MLARYSLVLIAGLSLVACGGSNPPPSPPTASSAKPVASAEAPLPPSRPGRLSRAEVVATLSRGLGAFLAKGQVEPALANGRFRGWRIVKLDDPMWRGVDLAPGDVVNQVNGLPIEHPEQALGAFQSLAIAKELRVTLERNGGRRELVYPIDD